MKLFQLLLQRETLLQQARLANLAFAYWHLNNLVTRIADAQLHGKVCLRAPEPAKERYWPVLTALEGNQSVIEEHFTDENILELTDLMIFLTGVEGADTTFMLEDLARFINPLKRKLERAGVEFEPESPRLADTNQGDPAWT